MLYKRVLTFLFLASVLGSLWADDAYLHLTLEANYSALGFATIFRPDDVGGSIAPEQYEEIREEAVRMMLEEARWIFSGMIYGFDFRYIPGNQNEEFEELFVLEPIHQLPKGDSGLQVQQVEDDYQNLRVRFHYWPDSMQKRRLSVPDGGTYRPSTGEGGRPMMEEGARIGSLEEGVKQALRSDLRSLLYNRPLEVRGRVFLAAAPRMRIRAGEYVSTLKVLYRRKDLETFPLNY